MSSHQVLPLVNQAEIGAVAAQRQKAAALAQARPDELSPEDARDAVKALHEKRMREAEAAHERTTRRRVLLHQSVWHAMHTEDCYHFAELDDAFNAVGDGYEKVPLSLMCNEKKVLIPGYRSSAPSVHAYASAVARVSQMARNDCQGKWCSYARVSTES
jgi:hypothetical protein